MSDAWAEDVMEELAGPDTRTLREIAAADCRHLPWDEATVLGALIEMELRGWPIDRRREVWNVILKCGLPYQDCIRHLVHEAAFRRAQFKAALGA